MGFNSGFKGLSKTYSLKQPLVHVYVFVRTVTVNKSVTLLSEKAT